MLTSDQQNNNHSNNTKKKKHKPTLPDRVGSWYYKHGLFLSSYPTCASSISIVVVLFCCFPLLNIPFPGTIPTKIILPHNPGTPITTAAASISEMNHQNDNQTGDANHLINNKFTSFALNTIKINNLSLLEPPFPSWARLDPFVYVQQIVLRTSVQPWTEGLKLTDAFRGPLFEVFKLLEFVRNHEDENKTNLGHVCLHVESVKRSNKENLFPQYNCLILSPANFWQQSTSSFKKDTNLLNTIFQNHNLQKTRVSTAEMLFGMPLRDTGIKRYPMRCRPRIIQYAVTLVLKSYDQYYLESLKAKLQKFYPLHQNATNKPAAPAQKPPQPTVMFIYYPGEFNLLEFLPLCGAFVIQFLYVYFSVRKIDVIRSRFILAACSVITVLGSLVMSLGLCFFFGLTISMQSRSVFPYLVILVGLENVLVLTKSVVTTDDNLDVKIRVAQGLSLEGWSITKNLMTEITILTIGLATFVPVIQEFSIFAIVGLLSDFFLQMLFFSTVLAMDIKRVEYSAEVKHLPKVLSHTFYQNKNLVNYRYTSTTTTPTTNAGIINRSRSHPKLTTLDGVGKPQQQQATDVIATTAHPQVEKKIPKRLRVVNFWARTRFFQRGFMIWMVLWISNIIYNSGLIEELFVIDNRANESMAEPQFQTSFDRDVPTAHLDMQSREFEQAPAGVSKLPEVLAEESLSNSTEQLNRLRHPEFDTNFHLSNFHWASIMKQYNISISGQYVTVLPTIRLSHAVPPEMVEHLRNPHEKAPQHFQWKALAVALDPIDFNDMETDEVPPLNPTGRVPLYPKTPMELLLTGILCAVSVFVLAYTMVVLYRCICSRNYAEWRASWNDTEVIEPKTERVLAAHPIPVNGHTHRIECLVTDGNMVASSCLQGQLKIWDATNGELVSQIDRRQYFEQQRDEYFQLQLQQEQLKMASGSETSTQHNSLNSHGSGSPPPSAVLMKNHSIESTVSSPTSSVSTSPPKSKVSSIKNKINFNFSSQDFPEESSQHNDFQLSYQKYFSATPTNHLLTNGHGESEGEEMDCGSNEFLMFNTGLRAAADNGGRLTAGKHRRNHSYSSSLVYRKNATSFEAAPTSDYQIAVATAAHHRSSLSSSPHSSQFRSQLQLQQQQSPCEAISRRFYNLSPIWCLDFMDNLIVIGCADGRLEFWEGTTGSFKCIYENQTTYSNGVTNIKLAGDRLIVARLKGKLDFLRLETYTQGRQIDWGFTSAYRRTHVRTGSAGSLHTALTPQTQNTGGHLCEELRCILESQLQGHQQPITCLEVVGNTVLTGSQDHTLKVFRLESTSLLYTLHGHYGPITSVFVDSYQSGTGGSGSQDGLLCVWDLITGACMYKIQAHYEAIVALVCTPSYVISLGLDEKLRVWERFQGHLLNTINVMHAYSGLLMLTPSLLVTGKPGSLVVWDVHTGEPAREVKLDGSNQQLCPKYMLSACGSVICDFGNQMRIVRFPLVAADKCE